MKKTFWIAAVLLVCIVPESYGEFDSKKMALSPSLGLLFAGFSQSVEATSTTAGSVTASADISYSPKLSFLIGGLAEYRITPKFSIESGLLFNRKKFSIGSLSSSNSNLTLTGTNGSADVGVSFLELPILGRFYPLPFLSLGLGPYFAFGVSDISVSAVDASGVSSESSSSLESAGLDSGDFGVILSAKGMYGIKPTLSAFLDVRYQRGLKNITSAETITVGTTTVDISSHTSAFQIIAGVRFAHDNLKGFKLLNPHVMRGEDGEPMTDKPTMKDDRPKKKRRKKGAVKRRKKKSSPDSF